MGEKGAHVGHARQRGVRTAIGARTAMGAQMATGGALGGGARPRGAYARPPNDGRGLIPRGGRGTHMRTPIIGGANGGRARLQGGGYICLAFLI
jgi:hypothetical protein